MRSEACAIALVAATLVMAVACASGEDKDGATTFARPDDANDQSFDHLDDGGSVGDDEGGDEGPGATSGDPQAGSVTDSSDPTTDPADPMDPTDSGDTGMDPAPPPPGDPPPPAMPPPDLAPCEAFCMVLGACGLEPDVPACLASECVVTDGGACDAAFNAMYACVASQPDCTGVNAWWNAVPGYPCEAQDAQVDAACF